MPELPDQSIHNLTHDLGLPLRDAKILVASENGEQLQYFDKTLSDLVEMFNYDGDKQAKEEARLKYAKVVANWYVSSWPAEAKDFGITCAIQDCA